MKKFLIIFTILASMATMVYADGHGYRSYDYPAKVIVRDKVVEYDPDRFIGAYGLYDIADGLTEKHEEEKKNHYDLEIDLLQKQIELLKLQLQLKGVTVPVPDVKPEEKPVVSPYSEVTSLFVSKCAKCHGDSKQDAGLKLIENGKLVDLSAEELNSVHVRTYYSKEAKDAGLARMPKGAPPLTDAEMKLIDRLMVLKSMGK